MFSSPMALCLWFVNDALPIALAHTSALSQSVRQIQSSQLFHALADKNHLMTLFKIASRINQLNDHLHFPFIKRRQVWGCSC